MSEPTVIAVLYPMSDRLLTGKERDDLVRKMLSPPGCERPPLCSSR